MGIRAYKGEMSDAHDEVVRDSFRHQVDAFSGPDSVYARREGPLAWIEPLDASMIVLDVACGAAHAAESVAPLVRQFVGIDLTSELLDLGAERLRQCGMDNVLLQEGNARALPFVRGSFDIVFCRSSLHHFEDPQGAVAEMTRVTRPGGRVVLVDLVAPAGIDRDRFDHLHRLLDPSHVRTFVEGELAGAFPTGTTISYADTSVYRFPIDVAMSDQSDRDAVLSALRDECQGGQRTGFDPADDNGAIVVSFITCVVHGTVP
jgi:ubiquinone/menaquinone biosynthesis C-methylase UbiE